jgi:hypothetical protein
VGRETEPDQGRERREEDRPALEQRTGRGQGRGAGADSSAGSTQGARWGELYWPLI